MNLFTKHPRPVLTANSAISWASGAVFNPGAWYDGETIHLLFRAVPAGYRQIRLTDVHEGESTLGFENYVSYIGHATSRDGVNFTIDPEPFIAPDSEADSHGAEDPRITCLDGRCFVTYSALQSPAFDPDARVRIGLASTTDFRSVQKHGVIGPDQRDKDAVLFPESIGGRVGLLHRIVPDIQLMTFRDVEELCSPPASAWEEHLRHLEHHTIMRPEQDWEIRKIGAGPPPIKTSEGWLLIYHGVDQQHVYRAGLALLDLDDPHRVIARTRRPVLEPELEFERIGDVDNVVFPEGAVVIDGTLNVYYGAADRAIGLATAPMSDVLAALREEAADGR
ncbi:MAG TPA: glycosidase [Rhodothermales bacterium]